MTDMVTIRERAARIIDPSKWRVLDSQLHHVMHSHRSYEIEKFKDKDSLAKADAILELVSAAPLASECGEGRGSSSPLSEDTHRATAWVVLGSSGQWSDWSQWPVAVCAGEQAAKDYVGDLSARMREHYSKKPEMTDASYDTGKWDRAMKRWWAKGNRIDPTADDYDQPHYTAREVPFFAVPPPPAASVSPGMEPLQAAECAQVPAPPGDKGGS